MIDALSLEDFAHIGEIVTGATSIVVAAGVILAWRQLRLTRKDSKTGVKTGLVELMLEIDRALIDYPQARKYFDDGAVPKEDDEGERARGIAMALANALDHMLAHTDSMEAKEEASWRDYVARLHEESPVLRALLEKRTEWWPFLQAEFRKVPAPKPPA